MTITAFLLERLAEDEAAARAVLAIYEPDEWDSPLSGGNHFPAEVTLWDRFDPARVLAECAAKRAIIAEHSPVDPCDAHDAEYRTITCDTIHALAAIYSGHPDYQQEWALDG